jgi:gliding motility-associated-like protein
LNVIIFNRWGEIFFSSNDVNFRWDGTYKGSPAQQGIYGYIITAKGFDGDDYSLNGTITLVK